MAKYAIVKKGKVINVIEYDGKSKYRADGDFVKLPANSMVAEGWTYENEKFVEPETPKSE